MKILRLIFIAIMLLGFGSLAAQEDKWQISTENYNGNEYIIKDSKYICAIKNKKYEPINEDATCDIEFDEEGETYDAFEKRRDVLLRKLYDVANEVFDFSNIPVSRDLHYHLSMSCHFDSETKEYVGVYFRFNTEVKNYITLQKLNLLETKFLQAKINAGRTNLLDSNTKYFTVDITIPIGQE